MEAEVDTVLPHIAKIGLHNNQFSYATLKPQYNENLILIVEIDSLQYFLRSKYEMWESYHILFFLQLLSDPES